MKKKLMAILAAFVAITPLAGVKAAEIDYSVGVEQNFIVNKDQEEAHAKGDETVGIKIVSLGEDPTDSNYVKGLAKGAVAFLGGAPFDINNVNSFNESIAYETLVKDFNGEIADGMTYFNLNGNEFNTQVTTPYVKNYNTDPTNLSLPTKDEFLSWFENTKVDETHYSLTAAGAEKFQNWYLYSLIVYFISNQSVESYSGYLTSSYEKVGDDYKVWIIVPTFNDEGIVTAVSVEQVSNNALIAAQGNQNTIKRFMMVPVLSFNKTYNCRFEVVPSYSCYKCEDKYQWLEVGKQASTCTIVSGVTSKAKCTDNPKTGVEDYILEFAVAAGICGIVLLAVKRKSLFSRV
jgi:hypothetical protein